MRSQENDANNGQLVAAVELDEFTQFVYGMMGCNPDDLGFEVSVWRPEGTIEEMLNATLEEAAPLHLEFFSTYEEAQERQQEVLAEVNAGTFTYAPPVLPPIGI